MGGGDRNKFVKQCTHHISIIFGCSWSAINYDENKQKLEEKAVVVLLLLFDLSATELMCLFKLSALASIGITVAFMWSIKTCGSLWGMYSTSDFNARWWLDWQLISMTTGAVYVQLSAHSIHCPLLRYRWRGRWYSVHAFLDLKTQDFFFPLNFKTQYLQKDKQPVTLALNYLTHYLFVARIVYYFSLLLLLLCGLFARKY